MKKYSKDDQVALAAWSLDCAERVLPLFQRVSPTDERPLRALDVGRAWVQTGLFEMAVIRSASLGAHAAAKSVLATPAACCAAHAAGQAVATAHVTQHAYGGAYYALKALVAVDPASASHRVAQEWGWQAQQLPVHLRESIMSRLQVEQRRSGLWISIQKGPGF
ncbi:putative immunity protein [Hymenobacter volaticus]|uniref:Imm-5-like domain-containing protein n=1 Tax=Hymenobacter volaticus TaxID=2932254 RepID=A0ABY4GFS4_9BACT|nr:hypothetical protein [Hymenobacter volaticus]UOQ69616.1 hypothetical protein MUN86_29370 [Hymenobacter volaticus]